MRTRPPGHSLLELIVSLLLAGVACGIAAPVVRATLDQRAVRAARDELAAALARTRAVALLHGGAALEIDPVAGTVQVRGAPGEPVGDALNLRVTHGIALETGGAALVEVRYDALGIGRLANRTIRLRRGRAEAGITISAYGRWRVW